MGKICNLIFHEHQAEYFDESDIGQLNQDKLCDAVDKIARIYKVNLEEDGLNFHICNDQYIRCNGHKLALISYFKGEAHFTYRYPGLPYFDARTQRTEEQ